MGTYTGNDHLVELLGEYMMMIIQKGSISNTNQ